MTDKMKLTAVSSTRYEGDTGVTVVILQRESDTVDSNGDPMNGRWVLRMNGMMIDYDQYRTDIESRNNLILGDYPKWDAPAKVGCEWQSGMHVGLLPLPHKLILPYC